MTEGGDRTATAVAKGRVKRQESLCASRSDRGLNSPDVELKKDLHKNTESSRNLNSVEAATGDEWQRLQKGKLGLKSAVMKERREEEQFQYHGEHAEDLFSGSEISLQEATVGEGLQRRRSERACGEGHVREDFISSHSVAAHSSLARGDATLLTRSNRRLEDVVPVDTSIEENAALIWPRCQRRCQNCHTRHVEIPKSAVSEDCIRVSMFVRNVPLRD